MARTQRDRGPRLIVLSWRELREQAEVELRALSVDAPDSEARWMIERVSGYDGVELVMGEAEPASDAALGRVDDMVARRGRGEPLQYVLGEWQFLGLDLLVDRRVLVPRPETEVVAQVAIDEAARLGARRGPPEPWAIVDESFPAVDLGTGSGALALALVSALPDVFVWATDVSDDALAVARKSRGYRCRGNPRPPRVGILVRPIAGGAARPAARDRGEPALHRGARGARPPARGRRVGALRRARERSDRYGGDRDHHRRRAAWLDPDGARSWWSSRRTRLPTRASALGPRASPTCRSAPISPAAIECSSRASRAEVSGGG